MADVVALEVLVGDPIAMVVGFGGGSALEEHAAGQVISWLSSILVTVDRRRWLVGGCVSPPATSIS